MAVLVIQHAVADYAALKQAFDRDPMERAKNGVTRYTILRPADDPKYVFVSLEFDTVDHARAFHVALRTLWQRVGDQLGFGGAEGVHARVLEEVERVEY